jgi:hypothetical protein
MRIILRPLILLMMILVATSCSSIGKTDAEVVSKNISTKADMFEINRRIVFYNGITGEYILVIKGRCSIQDTGTKLSVTCRTGQDEYKKHYLGLSDNVTYFSEQIDDAKVGRFQYDVIFKPKSIIPKVKFVN